MCGDRLVTKQSGEEGFQCEKVYIVETVDIDKEVYVALTLDRASASPVFIYSSEGGMAIEDVAEETPEKIHKIWVDVSTGLTEEDLAPIAKNLGLEKQDAEVRELFKGLYDLMFEKDADMVEINPYIRLKNQKCMAIDAKITCDENAGFRQKDIVEAEDTSTNNHKE